MLRSGRILPVALLSSVLACSGEPSPASPEPSAKAPTTASGPATQRADPRALPPRQNPTARGGPPRNVLGKASSAEPPLAQPDPGPAPTAPVPDTTGCPTGMVHFQAATGPLCIHAYEVSIQLKQHRGGMIRQYFHKPQLLSLVSAPGETPTPVSFNDARRLCAHFGFHLCTSAEWEDACDGQPGAGGAPYPTLRATEYAPGDCNFTHTMQGGTVPLAQTGSYPWCVNAAGVADMLGNIWEWSDPGQTDDRGAAIIDKRGGSHYGRHIGRCDQPAVGTHQPDWYGSVGFRCCATPAD